MYDYHAHLAPDEALASAVARKFMRFPKPWPEALTKPAKHLEQMKELGISARYLSVPPILFGYELPLNEQIAHARQLNDWILQKTDGQLLRPTGILPLSDQAAALEELQRITAAGIRSIAIGTHVNDVPLDTALDDDFWAAASKLEFVLMHPWKVRTEELLNDYGLGNPVGNPVETTIAATRLMGAGVMSRHPKLRMILAHGGGTLPFLIGRLHQGWLAAPHGRPDPVEEAKRFLYDTVVFQPEQLRHIVDVFGIERVVMGTDSPFDMAVPDPYRLIKAAGIDPNQLPGERIPVKA